MSSLAFFSRPDHVPKPTLTHTLTNVFKPGHRNALSPLARRLPSLCTPPTTCFSANRHTYFRRACWPGRRLRFRSRRRRVRWISAGPTAIGHPLFVSRVIKLPESRGNSPRTRINYACHASTGVRTDDPNRPDVRFKEAGRRPPKQPADPPGSTRILPCRLLKCVRKSSVLRQKPAGRRST